MFKIEFHNQKITSHIMISHFELSSSNEQNIIIQGINGSGKTTLLEYLHNYCNKINLEVGCINNNILKMQESDISVIEFCSTFLNNYEISGLLYDLLMVEKIYLTHSSLINQLSVGQFTLLIIYLFIRLKKRIILLDEPINNLSLPDLVKLFHLIGKTKKIKYIIAMQENSPTTHAIIALYRGAYAKYQFTFYKSKHMYILNKYDN